MMTILAANPFLQSFFESDLIGKAIFIGLFILSVVSWTLIIHKILLFRLAEQETSRFEEAFQKEKSNPLHFEYYSPPGKPNPLYAVYAAIKNRAVEVLNKNRHFTTNQKSPAFLTDADIHSIDSHALTKISEQSAELQKNIYILSTVVTLAPFLGLLGTVWGILITFGSLQSQQSAGGSEAILGGLALALTTTVLGLIVAIPALIGYNFLRNRAAVIEHEMETFSAEIVSSIEMQYRIVEIKA